MPGLIDATVAIWPGAVSSPSRSVKFTVVDRPVTGPKGAAKSIPAVEKVPVELTSPSPDQLISPRPRTVPWTSAITPSVRRVSSSGWRPSLKVIPGTSRTAWPAPLERAWRMVTSVTLVPLGGWTRVPPARMSSPDRVT